MNDNFLIKTENLCMEYLGGKVVALDNVSEYHVQQAMNELTQALAELEA